MANKFNKNNSISRHILISAVATNALDGIVGTG
jgi:hypothetical protein